MSGLSSHPDPIIFLAGGPGQPGRQFIATMFPGTDTRDLITFDQRGVGESQPSLACPEVSTQMLSDAEQTLSVSEEIDRNRAARFRCRDRLRAAGVDLAAYDSAESAADVNDIRVVLGYDTINILAASYGTRLALTVMRDFPQIVRSAVLDSVEPLQTSLVEDIVPSFNRALELTFRDCIADRTCAGEVATLHNGYTAAVQRLNLRPIRVPSSDRASGKSIELVLTGDWFVALTLGWLYSPATTALIPQAIAKITQGDDAATRDFFIGYTTTGIGAGNSVGMSSSVVCNEFLPFSSKERTIMAAQSALPALRDAYLPYALFYFTLCDGWPSKWTDPRDAQPVVSDIPTLLLARTNDPVTPPAYGQLAARTLSKATFIEFLGAGHAYVFMSDGQARVADFFNDLTIAGAR